MAESSSYSDGETDSVHCPVPGEGLEPMMIPLWAVEVGLCDGGAQAA